MRCHWLPRKQLLKEPEDTRVGENVGEPDPSYPASADGNGATTTGNSLLQGTRLPAVGSSLSTRRDLEEERKRRLYKDLYTSHHSSFVCDRPKREPTRKPISRRADKETLACPVHGIRFRSGYSELLMKESQNNYAE